MNESRQSNEATGEYEYKIELHPEKTEVAVAEDVPECGNPKPWPSSEYNW